MISVLRPEESRFRSDARARRGGILVLSTSILTDRVFLYTDLLAVLQRGAPVTIWTGSYETGEGQALWAGTGAAVEQFPTIRGFPEVPHNLLRRLNDYTWDYHLGIPSRRSAQRHVRDRQQAAWIRALKLPARALAFLGTGPALEAWLERFLLRYRRSEEAEERLKQLQPDLVLTTGPAQHREPAVAAAAKRLGIPVLALIPSWDNLSTKHRMVFGYDGYVLWSEEERRQLHRYYERSRSVPCYLVGAPQFDLFYQTRFHESREQFCSRYGFRADLPIVVHAVGSPNFLKERYAALDLARRAAQGDLGDVQLLIRPHPIHDDAQMSGLFSEFGPKLALQSTAKARGLQNEDQVIEWINTFRHADVVVNLASTVTVDAALFDRPVVNIDFDPEPGRPNQTLVEDVNHRWTHFKPVAESGGVWLVRNMDELVAAVRGYLERPDLHREGRRWITEFVCGSVDGQAATRTASAILDFLGRNGIGAGPGHAASSEASKSPIGGVR